jgi:8-oxo-dGTP pyrophosphatase MutT (NUDIX family)
VAALAARTPRQVTDASRREAAVALILHPDPDRLLVVRRAVRDSDPWSGQLALPGGRREPTDDDLLTTAIRETSEEVGIALDPDEHRATLDDLAPVTPVLPPVIVRPFAFRPTAEATIVLSGELDHAEWVSFEELVRPEVRRAQELVIQGLPRQVVGYRLPAGFLWGMTERILSPVVQAWRDLD